MFGLLYKDFVTMKKDILISLAGMLFFSFPLFIPWNTMMEQNGGEAGLITGENMAFMILPLFVYLCVYIMISQVQASIFAGDERKVWSSYIQSTPLGANGQVLSKYYLTLALSFVGVIWGTICDIISSLVNGVQGSAGMIYIAFFFVQIFLRSFEIPFLVRFGQKHGKTYKILSMVVVIFVVTVYMLFGPLPKFVSLEETVELVIQFMDNPKLQSSVLLGIVSLFPYVTMLLYYLSYKLSCKFYQKGVTTYDA